MKSTVVRALRRCHLEKLSRYVPGTKVNVAQKRIFSRQTSNYQDSITLNSKYNRHMLSPKCNTIQSSAHRSNLLHLLTKSFIYATVITGATCCLCSKNHSLHHGDHGSNKLHLLRKSLIIPL